MPCDSSNTVPLTITYNGPNDYSVSPDPVDVPWHGCLEITLVDMPSAGCALCFDSDFRGRGTRIVLTQSETDGTFETANKAWHYTVVDPSDPCPSRAAARVETSNHTIQVGSSGGF